MKNLLLLIIVLMVSVGSYAQKNRITGKVELEKVSDVSLYTIKNGELFNYAKTKLDENGCFGFLFNVPKEGFYVIEAGHVKMPVYLKTNDNADVVINLEKNKYFNEHFTKNNTPENLVLNKWLNMSLYVRGKAIYNNSIPGIFSIFSDFNPSLDSLVLAKENFRKEIKTKNKAFNTLMNNYIDYVTEYCALRFKSTPRTKWPEVNYKWSSFYDTIVKEGKFNNPDVLDVLDGANYLRFFYSNVMSYTKRSKKGNVNSIIEDYFLTDNTRSLIATSEMLKSTDYEVFKMNNDIYGKYLVIDEHKKQVEDKGSMLYAKAKSNEAADFKYPDINGNMVALSDFKGKVVVVDVWATWCSPCRAEIPHLKKLEHSYKDNPNVVFLSVSVDAIKDIEKWKKMIKDNELGGVHLLAGPNAKIKNDYEIKGIPRFMVFSKDGKVASKSSPRPSDPRLKTLIDKELNK